MGAFVSGTETRVVAAEWWEKGEEVEIRRLGFGDMQRLRAEATRFKGQLSKLQRNIRAEREKKQDQEGENQEREPTTEFEPDVEFGLHMANLKFMELAIVGWTFKDDSGNGLPVSRGTIERLNPDYADFILDEITDLNPRRSEGEMKSKSPGDQKSD